MNLVRRSRAAGPRGRRILRRGARVRDVASVKASIEPCSLMGPSPAAFVRRSIRAGTPHSSTPSCTAGRAVPTSSRCSGCCGRCSTGSGSIEAFFAEGDDPCAPDIGPALESFSTRALALDLRAAYGSRAAAAGRLLLFPAAVERRRLQAAESLSALDGAARRGRSRRLDARRAGAAGRAARHAHDPAGPVPAADALPRPGWRMASRHHRLAAELDPSDPVRFDFSICHVGMMGNCGFGTKQADAQCPLRGFCRPPQDEASTRARL